MKLCTDTMTVLNKRLNPEKGWDEYVPTVISGVSWYSRMRVNVGDAGLNAANEVVVRVPIDADFGGKTYLPPKEYKAATIISDAFTFAEGDKIVKAAVSSEPIKPSELDDTFDECFTILGVTDNRRAPNAKHFHITGG